MGVETLTSEKTQKSAYRKIRCMTLALGVLENHDCETRGSILPVSRSLF